MNRRFWSTYATSLVIFAALLSGVSVLASLASMPSALPPGAGARLVAGLLRSTAPMAAGSALLLALALFSESLPTATLSQQLDRTLSRAVFLAPLGYAVAVLVALGAVGVFSGAFGVAPLSAVTRRDLGVGFGCTLLDTVLILLLTRRFALRLRETRASLPAKLIMIVTVTVPLRATLALLCAPLLPD